MKSFYADEVDIPYEDYKKLHAEGKCNLGIANSAAEGISRIKGALPKGSGTGYAFSFYNLIGVGLFVGSIYLSFTWNWWAFIPGFFIASFIFNMNRKSNAENVLDEALHNQEFYEELRYLPTVKYQLDESVVEKYKLKN